jgi:hypothetical protein
MANFFNFLYLPYLPILLPFSPPCGVQTGRPPSSNFNFHDLLTPVQTAKKRSDRMVNFFTFLYLPYLPILLPFSPPYGVQTGRPPSSNFNFHDLLTCRSDRKKAFRPDG